MLEILATIAICIIAFILYILIVSITWTNKLRSDIRVFGEAHKPELTILIESNLLGGGDTEQHRQFINKVVIHATLLYPPDESGKSDNAREQFIQHFKSSIL